MGNSWEIKNGVIPESLRSIMEGIAEQKSYFDTDAIPLPPWKQFVHLPYGSLGWRMGPGEDYIIGFRKWYYNLGEEQRDYYSSLYPEPDKWSGFYRAIVK